MCLKTKGFSHFNQLFLFFFFPGPYGGHRKEVPDMDQIKIGQFIASCRKEQGMTQANLL